MDDTPVLAKKTVWVDNQYSLLQDQIYHRFLHSWVQCRVAALRGELTWRTSPRAWGKSPARYWDAPLLVMQGTIVLGCMTILLQEPYFLLFNTISQEFLCIGLQSFEIFGARIISSFNFEIYSGWVSVLQFILSWSLITALQIINKRAARGTAVLWVINYETGCIGSEFDSLKYNCLAIHCLWCNRSKYSLQ